MEMDRTHVHECCNMNVVTLRKQVMIVWVGFILLRLFIKGTLSLEQIRTKRLELLRNYFHSCLRGDCLPISTCSFLTHIMGMSITIIAWMRMLLHECSHNPAMSKHSLMTCTFMCDNSWARNIPFSFMSRRHERDMNVREINYLILFNTLFYYYTLSYSLIPILHY